MTKARSTDHGRRIVLALVLAVVLTACWAINDWAQVGRLNLPDHDDMMRLAQVRDLIAGQGFNDWTQYRLAPPTGAAMHWSRIADLGPAAIILAATPLVGRHLAEIAAVILYPGALFAIFLWLSGWIAGRFDPRSAMIAMVLAALAYPANALFLPGRIDHHNLQILAVLTAIVALMRGPGWRSGAAVGACVAISLYIGLETTPQLAALLAVPALWWVSRGADEAPRLGGIGLALMALTGVFVGLGRPGLWSTTWCDAFTPASSTATLAGGALLTVLALASQALSTAQARVIAGGAGAAAVATLTIVRYPACLAGPYGPMDPFLRRVFLDYVSEASSPFDTRFLGMGLPAIGLMFAALAASLWFVARQPASRPRAWPALAVLAMSAAVSLVQMRGAYIGAAIAAPFLAQLIIAARMRTRRRTPALVAAWAVSAGMLWLTVPQRIEGALAPAVQAASGATRECRSGDGWQQVDSRPAGVVMAPMSVAAYIIGGTRHATVGAGYHRNNAGNRASYDFFLATPDAARPIGARWNARYVLICAGDFSELDVTRRYPASLATALLHDTPPHWLAPEPLRDTGLKLYRVIP